ncbi:MAG: MFS transporter, FSR family, fosmidomycin resistance protein [Rhodobacteraceae bacterium HLUCCA12]|nr:MAG: MFS transporter, FSR family, fosmidomycin resistance protein [Rhodobacteraceae bacterium HLUCCA12]
MTSPSTPLSQPADTMRTHYLILVAISLCHMINDVMQSLLAAIYPLLQAEFALSFTQIGLMTLAFMGTASVLQPLVGLFTDRKPVPHSLALGMGSTLSGLVLLAVGPSYPWLLTGAALIGIGSAVFHPEASRVARAAAGGRFGTAQSLFQVGGNTGHALGPLLTAFIVVPLGRAAVAAFAALALLGMTILAGIGRWHEGHRRAAARRPVPSAPVALPRRRVVITIAVLAFLVFSKNVYTASISSYYIFFLIERFALSTQAAQMMLFLFLGAAALGVMLGGILGDRFGVRWVIWFSILGVLPFTLMLPYANLFWTGVLTVLVGFILASAFPAIVVFAQELVPGRVGMIAGLFFGLAFGIGGLAAAALGVLADARGIEYVYRLCSYLPALGLLTIFLPRLNRAGG